MEDAVGHQTLEDRSSLRHESANLAVRNWLVEAYREREALLRSRTAAGTSHDLTRVDHPLLPHADEPRRDLEPHLRETPICGGRIEYCPDETRSIRGRLAPRARLDIECQINPSHGKDHTVLPPEIGTLAKSVVCAATKVSAVVARNVIEAFVPPQQREADHDIAL